MRKPIELLRLARVVHVYAVLITNASIAAAADEWGWALACWGAMALLVWTLYDERRRARAMALDEFQNELATHLCEVMESWLKQRSGPLVVLRAPPDEKGRVH